MPTISYEITEKLADFTIISLYIGIFRGYPHEIAEMFTLNELICKIENSEVLSSYLNYDR